MRKIFIVAVTIIGVLAALIILPMLRESGVGVVANTTNASEYWGMAEFNLLGPVIIVVGLVGMGILGIFWDQIKEKVRAILP